MLPRAACVVPPIIEEASMADSSEGEQDARHSEGDQQDAHTSEGAYTNEWYKYNTLRKKRK